MKKVSFIIGMFLLFILPNAAFAHTNVTSSNPEEGSTIIEPINEIVLTFNTKVESLSTIKLMKNGSDIPLEIEAEGDTLKGMAANELENGTYTADWKIIGEDGHEIDGTLSFEVQQEVKEEEPQTTAENENVNEDPKDQKAADEDKKTAQTDEQKGSAETEEANNNATMTLVLVGIGILAVIGIVFLMKKKG